MRDEDAVAFPCHGQNVVRDAVYTLAAVALLAVWACNGGGSSPTRPSPIAPGPGGAPSVPTERFGGVVTEPAGFPVVGANVRVTLPSGEQVNTVTGVGGGYSVAASGDVSVRVDKDSYTPLERKVSVPTTQPVDFVLQHAFQPGDHRGLYRLTVTASPSCSTLPSELTRATYDVFLDEADGRVTVGLRGADFVGWGDTPGFAGSRQGTTFRFSIEHTFEDGYSFAVAIPGVGHYLYLGTATGEYRDGRISAVLEGGIGAMYGRDPWCDAPDHRLDFVR